MAAAPLLNGCNVTLLLEITEEVVEALVPSACLLIRCLRTSTATLRRELEPKARIELAAVVFSTAGETSNRASNFSHAREFPATIRTTINKAPRVHFCCERQIVTARFVGNSEIAARFAPFRTVWSDSSTPFFAKLREQMRQLVTKCAIDLIMNHRVLLSLLRDNGTGTR
jgi:hypothetical protein